MSYADHFSIANLPYGVASAKNGSRDRGVATRLGDLVVFLSDLDLKVSDGIRAALTEPTLNALAASGREDLQQLRASLKTSLSDEATVSKVGVKIDDVKLHLPVSISTFTDFSCSKEHLYNAGEAVFGKKSMPPAALHLPIGYTGTACTIVVSDESVQRPNGIYRSGEEIKYGPSQALDYELEFAAIVGKPSKMGERVKIEDADDHIFGLVILNDWSARDIQGFEMTPLGPMNGKSFRTSISPWVVPLAALEPFAATAPPKDFAVSSFLQDAKPKPSYDIKLKAEILQGGKSTTICTANLSWMYWTFRDLVAQHTVNGCHIQTGDVLATGTVSGTGDDEHGCLLEMTKGGKVQHALSDGTKRVYLEDGDGVRLTAYCGNGVGFGDCTGFISAASPL